MRRVVTVFCIVVCCLAMDTLWAQTPVSIPDATLKQLIEDELWVMDPTDLDMLTLTELSCVSKGIQSISGLEYAVNLQKLSIRYNYVSDLSPLTGLTKLKYLDQAENEIQDISPLANLVNLTHLDLHENNVSDVSPLSNLVNLQTLVLRQNKISDISALSGLTKLTRFETCTNPISDISALSQMVNITNLNLLNNWVSDITPLRDMVYMKDLNLQDNRISDISPLLNMTSLERINLKGNLLNQLAYTDHLQQIRANNPNAYLEYDLNTATVQNVSASDALYQHKIRITWQAYAFGPDYTSYYKIYRSESLHGTKVAISDWQESIIYDDTAVEPDMVYYYFVQAATSDQGVNAVAYSNSDSGYTSQSAAGSETQTPVVIPDAALKQLIEAVLWISDPTIADMLNLIELNGSSQGIQNLQGLEYAVHLKKLILKNNHVTDLSPLKDLTELQHLDLVGNDIEDINDLASLTELTYLDMQGTGLEDLSPLLSMSSLGYLNLTGNTLNQLAYSEHLYKIKANNPYVYLKYSPNSAGILHVSASDATYTDKVRITWQTLANGPEYTSYYKVYRSDTHNGFKEAISTWQDSAWFDDMTAQPDVLYYYSIQTATSDQGVNSGQISGSDTGYISSDPVLTVTSTVGGNVVIPGEGAHQFTEGSLVTAFAESSDLTLFAFSHWTGTACDAGLIADVNAMIVDFVVDGDYTLHAHFVSLMDTLYVDVNHVADANENGTLEKPFSSIQDAVDVCVQGGSVKVAPGTYWEAVDLQDKSIRLLGFDVNDPNMTGYPIIDANESGPVLSITQGQDPNCLISGFIFTRGPQAMDIQNSSPTITHCIMAGNGLGDPNSAAVTCENSSAILNHCTITDNNGGVALINSDIQLKNSIVWGNAVSDLLLISESTPIIHYTNTQGPWMEEQGVINTDPLFVQTGYWQEQDGVSEWVLGDYHLQSQTGRWDSNLQTWITDNMTSPCIDSGDPLDLPDLEPAPNGLIVNMGAYGNTAHASKSR